MAVENHIRKFRLDKGWSEEALALALRTEAKQIQRWEKNMIQPSIDEAFWLASLFGCSLEDIFTWKKR